MAELDSYQDAFAGLRHGKRDRIGVDAADTTGDDDRAVT
jgi:hypothetical protein